MRCYRCGTENEELISVKPVFCQITNCPARLEISSNTDLNRLGFLCLNHKTLPAELENMLDEKITELNEVKTSLKKEIKLLQTERLELIQQREDKVYLVTEKLGEWKSLITNRHVR